MTTPTWTFHDTSFLRSLTKQLNHAINTLELAESFDASAALPNIRDTFNDIGLTSLKQIIATAGEPGVAGDIIEIINQAEAAFADGEPTAIRHTTSHHENDTNGNDHTLHKVCFSANGKTVELRGVSALIRDVSGYFPEESSFNASEGGIWLEGSKVTGEINNAVNAALGSMALALEDDDNTIPYFPTAEAQAVAKALLTKATPLLKPLRIIKPADDA